MQTYGFHNDMQLMNLIFKLLFGQITGFVVFPTWHSGQVCVWRHPKPIKMHANTIIATFNTSISIWNEFRFLLFVIPFISALIITRVKTTTTHTHTLIFLVVVE